MSRSVRGRRGFGVVGTINGGIQPNIVPGAHEAHAVQNQPEGGEVPNSRTNAGFIVPNGHDVETEELEAGENLAELEFPKPEPEPSREEWVHDLAEARAAKAAKAARKAIGAEKPKRGKAREKGRTKGLQVRKLGDFLKYAYPPVEFILKPWLPSRGLAMIAGYRGIGKTFVAMGVAYAIAAGGTLLGATAEVPRTVLYADGEMDPAELQSRFAEIIAAAKQDGNGDPELAKNNLTILSHADQGDSGIPDLSDPDGPGRKLIEALLEHNEVLILDNYSSLCRTGIENDAESWTVMQEWLRSLRGKGKTVIGIHHTGKPDKRGDVKQRGSSKREDILNTSIILQAYIDAPSGEFLFKFSKSRGFAAPEPELVRIERIEGRFCRLVKAHGSRDAEVTKAIANGHSQREIAANLKIGLGSVNRAAQRARSNTQKPVEHVEGPQAEERSERKASRERRRAIEREDRTKATAKAEKDRAARRSNSDERVERGGTQTNRESQS